MHGGDLKKDLNLTKIDDLVQFFQRLLVERTKSEKEDGLQNRPHCMTPATGGTPDPVEGAPKYVLYI